MKEKQMNVTDSFQTLAPLPVALHDMRYVVHKNEIIICGSYRYYTCYSYHILKNQYKFICSYPKKAKFDDHCVVKRVTKNNDKDDITLLSFGGYGLFDEKYTLTMKYVSVWNTDDDEKEVENENTKKRNNEWIPLTDNDNKPVIIDCGMNAIIGGSNNNLLFIFYYPKKIRVFNLNTFKYVKNSKLPIDNAMERCCFATNESINEMIVFDQNIRLSIRYDEDKNIFKYHKARTYKNFKSFRSSGCVRFNDLILFFGGKEGSDTDTLKKIYRYYLSDNTWMKYEKSLPISLDDCIAIMSEDKHFIHIFGTTNEYHMKTQVSEWIQKETEMEKQWMLKDKELRDIEECRMEWKKMRQNPEVKKLTDLHQIEKKKKKKEIEMIIEQWMHLSSVNNTGWIDDFNVIILRYIMQIFYKPSMVFQGHTRAVNSVRFSPDGATLVSSSQDHTIKIWDVESGKEIRVLRGHSSFVRDAQFSPDGTMIVSCSNDNTIRLWDIKSGTEIATLTQHKRPVMKTQFSPDGKIIVSCSEDKTIRLWDVQSRHTIQIFREDYHVNDVQFSPDGRQIIWVLTNDTISVWSIELGELIYKLRGHTDYVMTAQFSSDGKYIISSDDRTIRIWDVELGTQVKILNSNYAGGYHVKYIPDRHIIISCFRDSMVRLWDTRLGVIIQEMDGQSGNITGMDISSDNNTIVFCSQSGTIHKWKVL
ncbi:WD repeat-containing protein [Reticulomyxa filosa]|uniref:WD repeat-containing protein n=1 Tax=Reticulomyxa filosa TaxID=46433 RepID=X6LPZ7_RETFI|nr:WD repeat-containing protein [Reticulomyxa filosa]|eukprot:ETO03222.1 WD repeat-containing protein [Reticulomyxa filosa]